MNVSVYVKRHEYFKEWMTQLVISEVAHFEEKKCCLQAELV